MHQQYTLGLVVVACNTASTISLPAIKSAISFTRNGIIGLLATPATINSDYTKKIIRIFAKQCKVYTLGSVDLVKIVEKKIHGIKITLQEIFHIVKPLIKKCYPDTIVLGCTHFAFLSNELYEIFPQGTLLIESGSAVAHQIALLINNRSAFLDGSRPGKAFCTCINMKSEQLTPILYSYGFPTLKKLLLR